MTAPFEVEPAAATGRAAPGDADAIDAIPPAFCGNRTTGANVDSEVDEIVGDRVVATALFRQAEEAARAVVDELKSAAQLLVT